MIPAASEVERIEAEKGVIRHLYRLWAELLRAEALPELMQMLAHDVVLLPENAPPLVGRPQVEAIYRQLFAGFCVEQVFREEELHVAGDFAYVRGREDVRALPKNGGPAQVIENRRTLMILHRGTDGRWRFARGMTNSFHPG